MFGVAPKRNILLWFWSTLFTAQDKKTAQILFKDLWGKKIASNQHRAEIWHKDRKEGKREKRRLRLKGFIKKKIHSVTGSLLILNSQGGRVGGWQRQAAAIRGFKKQPYLASLLLICTIVRGCVATEQMCACCIVSDSTGLRHKKR